MARLFLFALACCAPAIAWTESVEFPWNSFPRQLWERELVWMKNIGIRHVSLPRGGDPAALADAVAMVRRVGIEADLEGDVPAQYEPLSTRHGGPITDPIPNAQRISLLQPDALFRSRELLLSGKPGLIWTNVEDTLSDSGYVAGAVSFGGQERAATSVLRRSAQLSRYWSGLLSGMKPLAGAGTRLPAEAISVEQYAAPNGVSLVAVTNSSTRNWTGDVRAAYPAIHRVIVLPMVTVPAKDSIWLPIGIPLTASPLCRACDGFAPADHLVYATAEVTAMEYENGILALEFSSAGKAEAVLQLSREPSGPLVAAGRPAPVEWDEKTLRARLYVPANAAATHHVRIGLATQAPDATAFFDSARVLLIGETNHLKAQFSSEAVAQRSGLRTVPSFSFRQSAGPQPLEATYDISVPPNAPHGDRAELAIEADGTRLSHAQPQLLRPLTVRFPDAVSVRIAAGSSLALDPAVIPFQQRAGREFTFTVRNNANEIRSFAIALAAEGMEFSQPQTVTVGASAARDVSFRVFPSAGNPGLRAGELRVTGAAALTEKVLFLALPQTGTLRWELNGFSFLETARQRASFLHGRWLEYLNKDSGTDALSAGGVPFRPALPASVGELDAFVPKPAH